MPRHAAFQQDYQAYRAAFGDQEEIAVVIEGADPALVSRFSDALYARRVQEKRLFLRCCTRRTCPISARTACCS